MEPRLERQFAALEDRKSAMLAEVVAWSDLRLVFKPNPTEWSALDVLDHLRRSEVAILGAMEELRQQSLPVRRVPSADNLRGFLLVVLFRTPARVKAPGSVSMIVPDNPADLGVLASQWGESRQELARFLESVAPSQPRQAAFQHPVSGWMTLPRTLDFLTAHIQHHGFQLQRLKQASHNL